MSTGTIDFSRPYGGPKPCDRCIQQGKTAKATRRVLSPEGDALGWMCRACADEWNRCIAMAIDELAAEIVADAQSV